MKLKEIQEIWEKDSIINPEDISNESIRTTKLHSKYYNIFSQERLTYKKLDSEYKQLYKLRYDYFLGVLSQEELQEQNWEPNRRKIIKGDIPMYIDASEDITSLRLRMDYQKEKMLFLESIINIINNRGYSIRAYIDWQRFVNGN